MAMATSYQKLSIADKRALDLSRVREPSLPCPHGCGVQLMAADLLAHIEQRCSGPPEPGASAKWVTHGEVMAMGVPRATLNWWTKNGHVRVIGERMDRKYLHRDLVLRIAKWRGFRRR